MVFRNVIQDNIQKGLLQFPNKEPMGIETNLFQAADVKMVSVGSGFSSDNLKNEISGELIPMVTNPLKPDCKDEVDLPIRLSLLQGGDQGLR